MNALAIIFILLLNIGISYLNVRVIAPVWAERNTMGWGLWLVIWSAIIQSTVGFSMPILLAEAFGLQALHLIPAVVSKLSLHLWYAMVILPVIGTALVLTAYSWIEAWKRRDFVSTATAAWNTYATASDIAHMGSGLSNAFSAIGDAFDSDDEGGAVVGLALIIAIVAVCGGALVTYALLDAHKAPARARTRA